ncbi:MAG: sugar ABC transporter ATP-binding protein [Spirochaetaceae bacterium]|nr:sugar ABC transporter ATP-binding protein [Spirochaetaceae bacterium]
MKNISKSFGAVKAVQDVSLSVEEAEIHGLLGENGAGKSTLMNVLGGVFRQDEGEIFIDGEAHHHLTPIKSGHLGIRFIHQELNLVNDLKVYENLFLNNELTRGGIYLNVREMVRKSHEIFRKMNLDIDPLAYVRDLDTSRKQLIEIAKALLFKCRLIIMDEPTTALTNDEIESLFDIMRGLKAEGISCIYISHKMPELFSICDKYTVLRDGKFIDTGNFCDIDEQKATEMLVGRSMADDIVKKNQCIIDELVFQVENLGCEGYFKDISFSLKKGEILAVTGLFGDGRGELSECLFGARKMTSGKILLKGEELQTHSIRGIIRSGISMVPRNRKERSILKDLSIKDNLSMAYFTSKQKSPIITDTIENKRYEINRKTTNIKAGNPGDLITSLSGGNQQKVVFSRWFGLDSDVYILDNPTQGIDVGAKFEIYQLITKLAEQGKSIIVFSSEFPEIHKIADRCLVMYKGEINKEFSREDLNEVDVMYYATGSNKKVS